MINESKLGMAIVTGIVIETVAGFVAGVALVFINFTSSSNPGDRPTATENKPTPPNVATASHIRDWDREWERVALEQERIDLEHERERVAWERERASWAREREDMARERERKRAAWEQSNHARREQLDVQNARMEALRRRIDELEERAANRRDAEPLRPLRTVAPTPQPTLLLLYYRVALQQTKQVEYTRINEIKHFLNSMKLSYACGKPWKDSGLSPLRVPVAIHETYAWKSCACRSSVHQNWIMAKMLDLGIETKFDKPEEFDD